MTVVSRTHQMERGSHFKQQLRDLQTQLCCDSGSINAQINAVGMHLSVINSAKDTVHLSYPVLNKESSATAAQRDNPSTCVYVVIKINMAGL